MAGIMVIVIWPLWAIGSPSGESHPTSFMFKGIYSIMITTRYKSNIVINIIGPWIQCAQLSPQQYQCDHYSSDQTIFDYPWHLWYSMCFNFGHCNVISPRF